MCSFLSCGCFYSLVCVVFVFMLNVTMSPALGVINLWSVIGYLLTLCQLWLPVKLIFLVMKLVSCVSGAVLLQNRGS